MASKKVARVDKRSDKEIAIQGGSIAIWAH